MINKSVIENFKTVEHNVDFCVVGGGLSGLVAAIAAARNGSKVILMHDRPVLGGNASSEVRMWIRGAHGKNMRETGIVEEIALENIYRNPTLNFSIWDSVLYEKVRFQENLELLLNCSCTDAVMDGNKIVSVKGWQTTTQKWHVVNAKIFADCSGDSVLAPLTGAEWRMGREASNEFNEDIAPEKSDNFTMGLSCLIQARETAKPIKYIAPSWANKYTKDDLPLRINTDNPVAWRYDNFWWMEIGGIYNTIDDTEMLRDKLLKVAFGVWDFIKNSGYCDAENWELEWAGFLPGKRESRRYVGDHVLNQNDVRSEGKLEDIVAYGGWSMDDHHPEGIQTKEKPTIFHPAPSPYGIPYRCLYSKNIDNLMFAGRNISATHAAMSSSRVMATCGILGQAMGTAAAVAIANNLLPRGVYQHKINELKQTLMEDDCYLPWNGKDFSNLQKNAIVSSNVGNSELINNGIEREIGDADNAWEGSCGDEIVIDFTKVKYVNSARIVFDSDLNRESWGDIDYNFKTYPMRCNIFLSAKTVEVPKTIVRSFTIEADNGDGVWNEIYKEDNNYQRIVKIPLGIEAKRIRLVPNGTWGNEKVKIYSFEVK